MLGVDFFGAKFRLSQKHKMNKLPYYLPYGFFVGGEDEGIVFLKPGALMRCYSFTCPDLGSSSAESINAIATYFNESIRRLGSGWAIHFESRREFTDRYPGCDWDNQVGMLIDAHRKYLYQHKNQHYLNYFFLTISMTVKNDIVSKGGGLLYKKDKDENTEYYNKENVTKEIQFFRDRTKEIISYIQSRLSIEPLNNSQLVTYLYSSISAIWQSRFAPDRPMFFDAFITDKDMEIGTCLKIGDKYCPIIAIRDFPNETYPAIFDSLNHADVEYRWVTRWIGMDKINAIKLIEKYQKHFNDSRKSWRQVITETATNVETDRTDPTAVAFEEDTNEARVEVAKDIASLGYYTCCLEVWDEDYDVAMDKARYIVSLINACGFSAKVETVNSFQAWLGMLPGNDYSNIHKTLISSVNCSHIIPLSSLWTGDFYNRWTSEHIGCGAPLLTASSFGSPFFLNLNIGDVFHSFIFGPSGAGKSTFLCLLETQFLKYKNSQVIVLDKDKTARGVCIEAGGSYVEPGTDNVAFQPLLHIDTEEELIWACEFIQLCLTEQHVVIDAKKSEAIRQALLQLQTKKANRRDITTFQQYVQDEEIRVGIQPYTVDGQYGNIFDAHSSGLNISRFTMIEMGTLMRMGSQCITPALMYIFRLIEGHFAAPNDDTGYPTLLVLDEAWVFLANEYFAQRIDDWLRTLRKRRVAVVFATQDVVNAAKSSISSTIISQCQTRFYLADPNATSELLSEYYTQFGLEPSEIATLSTARMKRDYFYKSPAGARLFQLELDDYQLALLCPPKKILDQIEAIYGRNSGKQVASEVLKMQGFDPSVYLNNS